MYRLKFLEIPQIVTSNIQIDEKYDLPTANQLYLELLGESPMIFGELIKIELVDTSTSKSYNFEFLIEQKADLKSLINDSLEHNMKNRRREEIKLIKDIQQDVNQAFERTALVQSEIEHNQMMQSDFATESLTIDLADYLNPDAFLSLQKLEKLKNRVAEKVDWSPKELFNYFNFIEQGDYEHQKQEFLLDYNVTVDLKNLQTEIDVLINTLKEQAAEDLELYYQKSQKDTSNELENSKNDFKEQLNKKCQKEIHVFKNQLRQTFADEIEQLNRTHAEEIELLKNKHQEQLHHLKVNQSVQMTDSEQDFANVKQVELESELGVFVAHQQHLLHEQQRDALYNYKDILNHEQFRASANLIERLQLGERKIIETLFNVLRFNVLKQEEADFNQYNEQLASFQTPDDIKGLEKQISAKFESTLRGTPQANFNDHRKELESLKAQNELLESRLKELTGAAVTDDLYNNNASKRQKWRGQK